MRMTQQQQQRDDQGQRDEEKEVAPARAERGEGNEEEAEELKAEEDDDEDDDCFFESLDRVPSGISIDFDAPSTGSDSEDDVRVSFASAIAPPSDFRRTAAAMSSEEEEDEDEGDEDDDGGVEDPGYDYGIWMAEPISIKERRRLLLQGMGLASGKDLSVRAVLHPTMCRFSRAATMKVDESQGPEAARPSPSPRLSPPAMARSRSDTQLKTRVAGSSYTRASSAPPVLDGRRGSQGTSWAVVGTEGGDQRAFAEGGELFTIKNLDTGKEFVVSEVGEDGKWGLLNDLQTGVQLTMEELDRFLGYSPIVKEVMRRANIGADRKSGSGTSGLGAKTSSRGRGRRKGGWLKNIKVVASSVTGLIAEKERDSHWHSSSSSEWMKVHQHGKPYKELTGLYMCQEIQAHQGSIWSIKFSSDSRFLASAGEDRVVRVWQVLECDAFASSLRRHDTLSRTSSISLGARTSKRTRKGSSRRPLPDYIVIPETIFSLSDKPVCSFEGHLDDVLDLSWSKSRKLLSSSMDKTVRLWDMESKTCLRLFAHNDYVTCIQFNPIDDKYFISGSLDAKVRIWSIPDRQVVDWSDLHEMVTAACYTPDGQGALVGSHKGSCRFYKTSDSKLYQEGQIDIQNKKRKSHAKKITGFQFMPDNQSEVMITAADSQIRVFDGAKMVHKYRGFRNTSSQISASYSSDGKYVVCASEDSHVYVWKRDVMASSSGAGGKGKTWVTTRSHEHFHCRDVSVAIPWPSSGSNCKSTSLPSCSRRHKMIYDEQHLGCSDSIQCPSSLGDAFQSSRSPCPPPLPKKSASERSSPSDEELSKKTSASERSLASSEELRHRSRSGSGIRGSTLVSASSSSSMWSGPLSSITASITSPSSLRSWGWHGGGSNRASCGSIEDASAWGLVVVTAGLRGNIRIYQNFGLPIRLSRQTNRF